MTRAVVLAAVGSVVLAAPAAADAPTPGDYTSEVTAVDPPTPTVSLHVVGGDSFLELTVDPGTEVVVLGYEDEPFLRVAADGTVERNRNSPATYLNEDRYAAVDVPADLVGADPAALDPDWEAVADGGRYAWHDHRIHWMAPDAPPAIERGGSFDWNGTVPLLVDGQRVEVSGRIDYHADQSPVPAVAAGLVVAIGVGLLVRRRTRIAAAVAVVIGVAACLVAWATFAEAPPGVGLSLLPLAAAAVGLGAAVAALVLPDRSRPVALALVASVLVTWGLLRVAVLSSPVLPTSAPFALDRLVTATAVGTGVALLVGVVPLLARPAGSVREAPA